MADTKIKTKTVFDKHIYYQLGIYFQRRNEFKKAERCFRYASNAGHVKARCELSKGIKEAVYLNHGQRINLFAIELLEQLITHTPEEKHIRQLENAIIHSVEQIQMQVDNEKLEKNPIEPNIYAVQ